MPRVSTFYGVVIYMYWNERDHPVAHFHAYHAGRRASVSVSNGCRIRLSVGDWPRVHSGRRSARSARECSRWSHHS